MSEIDHVANLPNSMLILYDFLTKCEQCFPKETWLHSILIIQSGCGSLKIS